METYRRLEPVIEGRGEVKGYRFVRVEENPYAYIYEMRRKEDDSFAGYEVIKRVINKQFGCESYPGAKSWGCGRAYSCGTMEAARIRFTEITERAIKRELENGEKEDGEPCEGVDVCEE